MTAPRAHLFMASRPHGLNHTGLKGTETRQISKHPDRLGCSVLSRPSNCSDSCPTYTQEASYLSSPVPIRGPRVRPRLSEDQGVAWPWAPKQWLNGCTPPFTALHSGDRLVRSIPCGPEELLWRGGSVCSQHHAKQPRVPHTPGESLGLPSETS